MFDIVSGEEAVLGSIECLRLLYGSPDKYFNPNAFDEDWVKNEIRAGRRNVFTAIGADKEPAATLSVKKSSPFDDALEVGGLAVSKKYSKYGLGDIIHEHTLRQSEIAGCSCFYAYVVMHHTIAGKMCEKQNFVPAGFLFGGYDASKNFASFQKTSQKHSWAIYIKNVKNKNVSIYVPEYMGQFVKEVYDPLGVTYVANHQSNPLKEQSILTHEQDNYHKTLYIYISVCGKDISQRIKELEQNYNDPLQTVSVFLNISESGGSGGIEALKKMGYKISGLKPLCAKNEFVILNKTKDVFIQTSELKMTAKLNAVYEGLKLL